MRKPPFIPVLLSCLLAVAGHAAEAWTSDFPAALRRARSEGKTVLLDFTGSDWCAGCRRSRTKVLEKPEFLAYAAKHLVLVEVDFPERKPQDEALIQRLDSGHVALAKGEKWHGNEGRGLIHRSPQPPAGERRLLLTLDWLA
jgi:thiol-disulfide isomerase/thioredoxin